MYTKPLVSIVVPLFNGEDYINECVDSLLNQTFQLIEIIIVNDGSTDSSLDRLTKYKDKIKIYNQENKGQANALNFGWNKASGDYLGYLSCDDILKAKAIETLVETLNSNSIFSGAYCNYDLINSQSQILTSISAEDFSLTSLIGDFVCQPGPGALFKKSFLSQSGGWNTNLKQMPDQDFWMRLCLYGPLVKVNNNLAQFRIHETSQSYAISSFDKANEPLLIWENYFANQNLPAPIHKLKKRSLSSAYFISARLHLRSGRLFIGLKQVINAFMAHPSSFFRLRNLRLFLSGLFSRMKYRLKMQSSQLSTK